MSAKTDSPVKARALLLGKDATLESETVEALRAECCELILTGDREHALDIARTGYVDFLLVDFDLYSGHVSELALASDPAGKRCRILVLVHSFEQLTLACERLVDGVLMKPLDPYQVRSLINKLLADHRTHPEAEGSFGKRTSFSHATFFQHDA